MHAHAINKFCPRSGKPVAADSLALYKDHTVGFCNPDCRDDFQANIADRPKDTVYFDAVIRELSTAESHNGKPLPAVPVLVSETSSHKDFDFLFGNWHIHNRKLRSRLTGSDEWFEFESSVECGPILNGFANHDFFHANFDGKPFEGMAVRLFDPKTRLWSIHWADGNVLVMDVPQVGSFDGPIGIFLARDVWQGTPVIVKFQWDKTDPERPIWSQAFSADEGKTWEWNWYMQFSRVAAVAA